MTLWTVEPTPWRDGVMVVAWTVRNSVPASPVTSRSLDRPNAQTNP